MNSRLVVALSVVVIFLLAAGFLITMQQGATSGTSSSSTSTSTTQSQSSTSTTTGGSYVNSPENLQLRLSVTASSTGGSGGVTVRIIADEYNTLAAANNVSVARLWPLTGLSLGPCGTEAFPFGVALYRGAYSAGNVSQAQPVQIYPITPCPMLIRLVTAYLFQPTSDLAVVLPGGTNATATQMSANVTATAEYASGIALTTSSSAPLGAGTYTAAAGDEWGSVAVVRFTVGVGSSTSSTGTGTASAGTLAASFSVGPTQPVCSANATIGPAPATYSSIEAVVTPSPSGAPTTLPIAWISTGCSVTGTVEASLPPGAYSLSLSNCPFLQCSSALPKGFVIVAGQSTSVDVSIDTGIR